MGADTGSMLIQDGSSACGWELLCVLARKDDMVPRNWLPTDAKVWEGETYKMLARAKQIFKVGTCELQ